MHKIQLYLAAATFSLMLAGCADGTLEVKTRTNPPQAAAPVIIENKTVIEKPTTVIEKKTVIEQPAVVEKKTLIIEKR